MYILSKLGESKSVLSLHMASFSGALTLPQTSGSDRVTKLGCAGGLQREDRSDVGLRSQTDLQLQGEKQREAERRERSKGRE